MNTEKEKENENYLKNQLTNLGFGNSMHEKLEANFKEQNKKFEIPFTAEFKKGDKKELVEYNLNFAKSKEGDLIFLNNYQATLKKDSPEKEHTQTFFVGKNNNITAKEAFNLLDGRAVYKGMVNKEDEKYNTWLQMSGEKQENGNFKLQPYNDKYGFDLKKNLEKISMKDIDSPEKKEDIMKSLRKGNLTPVTLNLAGKEEKAFIEANPKDRSITIYDSNMIRQSQGVREHKGESKQEGQSKSENPKQEQKNEPEPEEKKARTRKAGVSR